MIVTITIVLLLYYIKGYFPERKFYMKKKIIALVTAVLLISGCDNSPAVTAKTESGALTETTAGEVLPEKEEQEENGGEKEENGGKFKQCLALRYGKKFYETKGIYYHTGNAYGIVSLASYDPVTKNTVVVMTSGAKQTRDKNGIYKICAEITESVYKNIDRL